MMALVKEPELTLILNACEGALQIIVAGETKIYVSQTWTLEHQATEILAPQLKQIIKTLGIDGFKRIAVVVGPGSFTGIRLVLTTALGLARTDLAILASLNFLQALAIEMSFRLKLLPGKIIWAATHARRGLIHLQKFEAQEEGASPKGDISLISPQTFLEQVEEGDYVVGSALKRAKELQGLGKSTWFSDLTLPGDQALVWLAKRAIYGKEDLIPLYIRSCDALDNLESLSIRQGLNPKEAYDHLTKRLQDQPKSEI